MDFQPLPAACLPVGRAGRTLPTLLSILFNLQEYRDIIKFFIWG